MHYEVWVNSDGNGDWIIHSEFTSRQEAIQESTRLNIAGGCAIVREVWAGEGI